MCVIICGFPGIGKTTAAKDRDDVIDVESSDYHYYGKGGTTERFEDPDFPRNYVNILKRYDEDHSDSYILASCHKSVRDELDRQGVPFIIVAPHDFHTNEYMKRFLRRHNSAAFINNVYTHWDGWLQEIAKDEKHAVIWLDYKEYLSDILGDPEVTDG